MKKHTCMLVLAVLLIPTLLFAQGGNESQEAKGRSITVYAYDSFVSEWGPGPLVVPRFEEQTGIKVNLISAGNGGELLGKLELEKHNPQADVVIGISNELLHETISSGLFMPYESPALTKIPQFLHFDSTYNLLPFNYGNYAFIYDSQKVTNPPRSLDDLLDPKWERSIILMDPRTSSVGMGLLEWTIAVYGENYLQWWEALKPNVLTIADGWSSGYGLFTEGEAPLVISYTTSPVYHILYEDSERFKAQVFDEGNMAVIEGVGIVDSTQDLDAAQQFVDFLLTEAQADIATANIMYPVNTDTVLHEAFSMIPKPTRSLMLDGEEIAQNRDKWLSGWVEVMSK
ncbi:thiamine ABC transporter substrate-binding protein [Pleomorphochaeta sp. DL1XJH-081]|uniref:thiamine ABC transporter substrate-binding protein n=1 Tax=Pleomorphochaeta sp. DL1XJH-081 TaxID=3409690 RepID=UPI003BB56E5C